LAESAECRLLRGGRERVRKKWRGEEGRVM